MLLHGEGMKKEPKYHVSSSAERTLRHWVANPCRGLRCLHAVGLLSGACTGSRSHMLGDHLILSQLSSLCHHV